MNVRPVSKINQTNYQNNKRNVNFGYELRIEVPQEFLAGIQRHYPVKPGLFEITEQALKLMNWAVDEASKGREVLSANKQGSDVNVLVMNVLERARENGR